MRDDRAMRTHPVTFAADYVERRSRVTTFFRLVLVIPHAIVAFAWSIAAAVVVILAWFALVFTGRWPQGMYAFLAGYTRYVTAVYGYMYLMTDVYPPFSGATDAYPVHLAIAPPREHYSRMKALFRIVLAIPVLIISYAMQIVAQIGAFLSWFAIVALGRQPRGLQEMTGLGLSYQQRSLAYVLLVTEDWPPFTDEGVMLEEGPPPSRPLPEGDWAPPRGG
jgi:uncharacterized protein DUF4389